jgi:hypothetical protein
VLQAEKQRGGRGLRVSRLGRGALDALAAAHADLLERGEVAAARGLYEALADVTHDDPAALAAWADAAARPGRGCAEALWLLANVEDLSDEAWPTFRRLVGEVRPPTASPWRTLSSLPRKLARVNSNWAANSFSGTHRPRRRAEAKAARVCVWWWQLKQSRLVT